MTQDYKLLAGFANEYEAEAEIDETFVQTKIPKGQATQAIEEKVFSEQENRRPVDELCLLDPYLKVTEPSIIGDTSHLMQDQRQDCDESLFGDDTSEQKSK